MSKTLMVCAITGKKEVRKNRDGVTALYVGMQRYGEMKVICTKVEVDVFNGIDTERIAVVVDVKIEDESTQLTEEK